MQEDHFALAFGWQATNVPGWCFAEVTVAPQILDEEPASLAEALAELGRG
ncbi:hypothetical protein GCM10027599_01460 [Yimella radicis]